MNWAAFFKKHQRSRIDTNDVLVSEGLSVEHLYQAFKARMLSEEKKDDHFIVVQFPEMKVTK